MKYKLAILSIISSTALAGGIGGGGLGKEQLQELAFSFVDDAGTASTFSVPNLGLSTIEVTSDVYRRTRLRLSAGLSETQITTTKGDPIDVKELLGGIVDISETSQLVIEHQ